MRLRIEMPADVHFGKPCIAGTRMPVRNVLELSAGELLFLG
jgi:uncharacterized protein (DUF433 family)